MRLKGHDMIPFSSLYRVDTSKLRTIIYRNSIIHCLDGPAVIYPHVCCFYYFLGKNTSEKGHAYLSNISFFTRRVPI